MAISFLTGESVDGNIALPDNKKIILGTGSDLEIYHDGFNSRIKDVGTGSLILNSGQVVFQNAAASETLLTATENNSVDLFYDNSKKFETTSTGVTVTGIVAATTVGVTNIVTNRIVKFNGSVLDDSTMTDDGTNVTMTGDFTVQGGDITLGGTGRIQGVDTVSANTDAANKLYVDNAIAGVPQGDITDVIAGDGMTGGGNSGSVTLNVVGGDGITANANDVEITPAQTTISSIYYDGLDIGGVSGVNEITFEAGKIAFRANSTAIANFYSSGLRPSANNTFELGQNTSRWSSVYATTFSGDLNGTINTATTGVTQSQGNNSTKIATTAYVDGYSSGVQTISEGTGIKVTNGLGANATVSVNYDSADTDNLIFGANAVSAAVATKPYTPYILAADSNPGIAFGEVKNLRL